MSEPNKTQPTSVDVGAYLASVPDPKRRADAAAVVELMKRVTGEAPVMWGSSIIGFGLHHYKYPSGREGDICVLGVSPRKTALTIYGLVFYNEEPLLAKLGPITRGKGCVYIKDLAAVDLGVLEELVRQAWTKPRMGGV